MNGASGDHGIMYQQSFLVLCMVKRLGCSETVFSGPLTITNYNYQLSKVLELSVRRKLPNPSSEMDDDLDGIIRQAKALATLGSKIIHVFPPWNSIEIIPHATTHTVHYVIKDDSCGAHDINASTKYHSVKAILLNK